MMYQKVRDQIKIKYLELYIAKYIQKKTSSQNN